MTPNLSEFELMCFESLSSDGKMHESMKSILKTFDLSWLLVTRGPLGMCLMGESCVPKDIPAVAREVYDVSGAGDTVIATLAAGVASGLGFEEAAALANMAAGIVVGKLGTQPITLAELGTAVQRDQEGSNLGRMGKVCSIRAAAMQVGAWQGNGERVILTNGCFDLLHPGHVHLLNSAKALGDRLIVGLNSDSSVSRLKGPSRPILDERDRACLLASLDCVDLVTVFEEDTPIELIKEIKPDVLVKGSDYSLDEVVGREVVEGYGGRVALVNLLTGYSTTRIAGKLLELNGVKQAER